MGMLDSFVGTFNVGKFIPSMPSGSQWMSIVGIIVFLIAIVSVVIIFYYKAKYKYKIIIMQDRGNGKFRFFIDNGMKKIKDGFPKLVLFKKNKKIPFPSSEALIPFGKKDAIVYYESPDGELIPYHFDSTGNEQLGKLNEYIEFWRILAHKEKELAYKSKPNMLMQLLPYAGLVLMFAFGVIMMYMMKK